MDARTDMKSLGGGVVLRDRFGSSVSMRVQVDLIE